MKYLAEVIEIVEDPLFWLWALLGAVVLIAAGILISWFLGKPVEKFFLDGDCVTIIPIARGEKMSVPIEMTEYNWFLDKAMQKPVPEDYIIKKRIVNFYSSKAHVRGGIEN